MRKLVALLGVILALAGKAEARIDTDYKGADAGFLVGSIGFTQPELVAYRLRYRAVPSEPGSDDNGLISISSKSIFDGRDYNDGTVEGHVIIHRLKPGTYEFFSGYVENGQFWQTAETFSYTFTIKPGEATYIGSFIGSQTVSKTKSIWGGDVVNGGTLRVADEHERDFAAARKHEPSLPPFTQTMIPDLPAPLLMQKWVPQIIFVSP